MRHHRPTASRLALAGACLLSLGLAACGAGDQSSGAAAKTIACDHTKPAKPVTVNVLAYSNPALDTFTDSMVKSCSKNNVRLQHAPIDFNGQYTKTPITLAAKQGTYDIIEFYTGEVAQYAAKKQIIPLGTLFRKYKAKFGLGGLNPKFLDAMKYDGQLYALPTSINVGVLAYRRDILNKLHLPVPKTYAQLASEASKIQKAKLMKYPVAIVGSDPNTNYEQTLGSLDHTTYVGADGKPTFDTPQAHRALSALTSLIPYEDPQVTTFDSPAVQQQLYNGQAAFAIKFSGSMADLLNPTNSRYAKDFGVAAPPSVEPGGDVGSSLSADGWAIAANSKISPDLLFQLIAASVSTKASTVAMPAAYPARTSVITTAKLPYAPAVQATLKGGALAPAPHPWFVAAEDASYTPLLKALGGRLSVDKALKESQAATVKALGGK